MIFSKSTCFLRTRNNFFFFLKDGGNYIKEFQGKGREGGKPWWKARASLVLSISLPPVG